MKHWKIFRLKDDWKLLETDPSSFKGQEPFSYIFCTRMGSLVQLRTWDGKSVFCDTLSFKKKIQVEHYFGGHFQKRGYIILKNKPHTCSFYHQCILNSLAKINMPYMIYYDYDVNKMLPDCDGDKNDRTP